jgi:hypothetical protein
MDVQEVPVGASLVKARMPKGGDRRACRDVAPEVAGNAEASRLRGEACATAAAPLS